jgi:hypothetical protein
MARFAGGASRDRTDDPLLAKQVLSQLSYGPLTRLFPVSLRCAHSSVGHALMYTSFFIVRTPRLTQKIRR